MKIKEKCPNYTVNQSKPEYQQTRTYRETVMEPSLTSHHHQLLNHINPPFHTILNFNTQFLPRSIANKSNMCILYLSQQNWILFMTYSRPHTTEEDTIVMICQLAWCYCFPDSIITNII